MWNFLSLEKRLLSDDSSKVIEAIQSLSRSSDPADLSLLCRCLFRVHRDPAAESAARNALSQLAVRFPGDALVALDAIPLRSGWTRTDARLYGLALLESSVSVERVAALAAPKARHDDLREGLFEALVSRASPEELLSVARLFRADPNERMRLRAAALLGASGTLSDRDLARKLVRGDGSPLVRRAAAQALTDLDPIERAVVLGDDAVLIGAESRAIPLLLREMSLSQGDEAPETLRRLESATAKSVRDLDDALLETLRVLPDPQYYSREFGSGHVDAARGGADAGPVRRLAEAEIARRSNKVG